MRQGPRGSVHLAVSSVVVLCSKVHTNYLPYEEKYPIFQKNKQNKSLEEKLDLCGYLQHC